MNHHNNPGDLADRLRMLADELKAHGETAWTKSHGWTFGPQQVTAHGERGGGTGEAQPEDKAKEAIEDRRAAKVHNRYLHALEQLRQAAINVDVLHGVILPGQPRRLQHSEMTAIQLIADNWCPSCYRDDQHFGPLTPDRYSDRCRPCGDYRKREGQDPPIDILRLMHRGKSLRERVAQAQTA